MRIAPASIALGICLLAGCGYVGPVLPPSPQIPLAVNNLTAVERGGEIVISFATPARTTDGLPIKHFSEIDLRVGPAVTPFDFDSWATAARPYSLAPPPPNDPDNPQPADLLKEIPASAWLGQHIAIAVRTAVKKNAHYSSWSNRVVLDVIAPLKPPVAKAEATAKGVLLTWPMQDLAAHYRILRQGPGDKEPAQVGESEHPEFVDTGAQYDTAYQYQVIATRGSAESLPSKVVSITPVDKFAPSVPATISALAGPDSIEVSWQRSPESDLAGYYLYRSVNSGPFERQSDLLTLPTYSDRKVERGKTYRYQVSAVDKKNNESARSQVAEVAF